MSGLKIHHTQAYHLEERGRGDELVHLLPFRPIFTVDELSDSFSSMVISGSFTVVHW